MDSEKMKTLTVAGVKKLMKERPGLHNLKGLTRLSDEVAEVLGTGTGTLDLSGLTELSPRVAAKLAKRKGDLLLNGLTSISVETAKALARYEGYLMMDGLTQLPDEVAAALAKFKGKSLDLDGLRTISNKGLATLAAAGMKGLQFGFKSISVEQAKILSEFKGGLGLDVHRLSVPVAAILGRRKGGLYLSLRSLSPEAARELARHRGTLGLNFLERISAKAAWQLVRHKGDIELCGVDKLSRQAAKALATVKGVIELSALENTTPGVVAELAQRPDKLYLGITTLTDGMARALSRQSGCVSMMGVRDLTDRQVQILLPKYAAGTLGLFHPRQKMDKAWEEARNNGRWPFRKRKGI